MSKKNFDQKNHQTNNYQIYEFLNQNIAYLFDCILGFNMLIFGLFLYYILLTWIEHPDLCLFCYFPIQGI